MGFRLRYGLNVRVPPYAEALTRNVMVTGRGPSRGN